MCVDRAVRQGSGRRYQNRAAVQHQAQRMHAENFADEGERLIHVAAQSTARGPAIGSGGTEIARESCSPPTARRGFAGVKCCTGD